MTPSPIPKVLSVFRLRRVRALLMGGQACILYGGAEFSRDVDFAVAVSPENLNRLRAALDDLRAEPICFPPLSSEVLLKGHACHFRCLAPGLHRLRVDVMSVMRGVDRRYWKPLRTDASIGREDLLTALHLDLTIEPGYHVVRE